MKICLGIAAGITLSILARQTWRAAMGYLLSRGDT